MSKDKSLNNAETQQLNIADVSNCCDCFIGFLSGEEVRKSDLARQGEKLTWKTILSSCC